MITQRFKSFVLPFFSFSNMSEKKPKVLIDAPRYQWMDENTLRTTLVHVFDILPPETIDGDTTQPTHSVCVLVHASLRPGINERLAVAAHLMHRHPDHSLTHELVRIGPRSLARERTPSAPAHIVVVPCAGRRAHHPSNQSHPSSPCPPSDHTRGISTMEGIRSDLPGRV